MGILIKDINIEDLQLPQLRAMLMFSGHEIVELPDHGDLVDRDELRMLIPSEELVSWFAIENAHVVIPAERREDGET